MTDMLSASGSASTLVQSLCGLAGSFKIATLFVGPLVANTRQTSDDGHVITSPLTSARPRGSAARRCQEPGLAGSTETHIRASSSTRPLTTAQNVVVTQLMLDMLMFVATLVKLCLPRWGSVDAYRSVRTPRLYEPRHRAVEGQSNSSHEPRSECSSKCQAEPELGCVDMTKLGRSVPPEPLGSPTPKHRPVEGHESEVR
jgi:hypothetical protein